MSTSTSILSLPNEVLEKTYHILSGSPGIELHYICSPPFIQDFDKDSSSFRDSAPILRNLINLSHFSKTTFTYTSSSTGSYIAGPRHPSTATDILHWLNGLDNLGNHYTAQIRKLSLEIHAYELLLLFAPPPAAELLQLPTDRGNWTDAAQRLRALRLNRLNVEVLTETCPGPCRGGRRNFPSTTHASGAPLTHFVSDPAWAVKAVLETLVPHLPTHCDVRFVSTNAAEGVLQRTTTLSVVDLEHIQGCSWAMLDSGVCGWHRCTAFDVDIGAREADTPVEPEAVVGDWDASPSTYLGPESRPEGKDGWDWSSIPMIYDFSEETKDDNQTSRLPSKVEPEPVVGDWQHSPSTFLGPRGKLESQHGRAWSFAPLINDSRKSIKADDQISLSPSTASLQSAPATGDEWEFVAEPKGWRIPIIFVDAKKTRLRLAKSGGDGSGTSLDLGLRLLWSG